MRDEGLLRGGAQEDSVVVVGNSSALLGGGCGRRIDSFGTVVRFNEFELAGYEVDVGTATSLHVVSDELMAEAGPLRGNRWLAAALAPVRPQNTAP